MEQANCKTITWNPHTSSLKLVANHTESDNITLNIQIEELQQAKSEIGGLDNPHRPLKGSDNKGSENKGSEAITPVSYKTARINARKEYSEAVLRELYEQKKKGLITLTEFAKRNNDSITNVSLQIRKLSLIPNVVSK
jgi:hypothetical protein